MSEEEFGFDDWVRRFEAMQDQAAGFGVASVVLLTTSDPLKQVEHFSHKVRGGRIRAVGMLQQTLFHLQDADR